MDAYETSKKNTKRYKKLKSLLKIIWGYDMFKPKQYEIINKIISGEDVCAILPTGYGKSLTYQLPAIYLDKPAIIICPLISLMDDQRIILGDLGLTSCCYNSTVADKSKMRNEIIQGLYQFVYITPESLISTQDFFIGLEKTQGISLIAIDEAHCISSYGFDFRKSYRELTVIKSIFPNIPVIAVTATATHTVGLDICRVLKIRTKPIKTSFNRPNLYIEFRKKSTKKDHINPLAHDIVPIIRENEGQSIIIYCLTIKDTEKITSILKEYKIKCGMYYSGMSTDDKVKTHTRFLNGSIKCVVATIAFGMGINKSNVRVIIHYGYPKTMEGYYQEIGRAGRDGKKAYCYMFHGSQDTMINECMIVKNHTGPYADLQLKLLSLMKNFISTSECRRKVLLEYFDEKVTNQTCNFCDNCCGISIKPIPKLTTQQDVKIEAKMLIDLIESIQFPPYGRKMYINILRGSKEKSIGQNLRKNKLYGSGSHKSVIWWSEVCDHLIKLDYLRQDYVKGKFARKVLKITHKGVTWASQVGLEDFGAERLEPVEMTVEN